jgi:S-adenosylmethionine synthetase
MPCCPGPHGAHRRRDALQHRAHRAGGRDHLEGRGRLAGRRTPLIQEIGYDNAEYGIDYRGCSVLVTYDEQSPDIARGVDALRGEERSGRRGLRAPLPGAVARPTSVMLTTDGTGSVPDGKIEELVMQHFDLRPKGIIQVLDLLRPIYRKTAAYGHFGRDEPEFTWERTDKAAVLASDAGLKIRATA